MIAFVAEIRQPILHETPTKRFRCHNMSSLQSCRDAKTLIELRIAMIGKPDQASAQVGRCNEQWSCSTTIFAVTICSILLTPCALYSRVFLATCIYLHLPVQHHGPPFGIWHEVMQGMKCQNVYQRKLHSTPGSRSTPCSAIARTLP